MPMRALRFVDHQLDQVTVFVCDGCRARRGCNRNVECRDERGVGVGVNARGQPRRRRRYEVKGLRRPSAGPRAVGRCALDLLELTDLAWHDCHGETSPPDSVVEDIWTVAGSDRRKLIATALLAVQDWRDLQVAAGRG
jgi:hypothetical protein